MNGFVRYGRQTSAFKHTATKCAAAADLAAIGDGFDHVSGFRGRRPVTEQRTAYWRLWTTSLPAAAGKHRD